MSLIGTMGSGVSALRTFMKGLEVIGNNIANVNTTGFKASEAKYSDSFSNILQRSAPSTDISATTSSTGVGTGVMLAGVSTNYTQGSLAGTGRDTDLGISGNGFFLVKDPADGQVYATRAGDFRWDDKGYLVTSQGYRVQGKVGLKATTTGGTGGTGGTTTAPVLGDIKLSDPNATTTGGTTGGATPTPKQLQSVTIDKTGNIVEFYSDGSSAIDNQIQLQNYMDLSALVKEGSNLYSGMSAAGELTPGTPSEGGLGAIQAGTLELSNVDLTDQFANLITTQRSFQAGSRLVTVSDSVLEDIVNLKR